MRAGPTARRAWMLRTAAAAAVRAAAPRARRAVANAAFFGAFAVQGGRLRAAESEGAAAGGEFRYPAAEPGYRLRFPRDHGAHPAFRTEWWYLTAWVDTPGGRAGLQVTFFRSRTPFTDGNPSRFAPRQLLFAHAAFSDPGRGRIVHAQIARRADGPHAQFSVDDTDIMIGPPQRQWRFRRAEDDTYHVRIDDPDLRLVLEARPQGPPWLQGENGFSRKGPQPEQASHYYSRPGLRVRGEIGIDGQTVPLDGGTGWLDHEWASALLADDASGWDWAGLNLDDGGSLMAFRIRDGRDTTLWRSAAERAPDGRSQAVEVHFEPLARWRSPVTGVRYPVVMRLRFADGRRWRLQPLLEDQEVDARMTTGTLYWEGAVEVLDEAAGDALIGRGYLELTGYGERLRL